jgi:DNA-binding LacI/PurR family transcriptional regulator
MASARLARPSLTALSLHPDEIGRRAVELLADVIAGVDPPPPNVTVPTRIIPRASTRRPVAR